MKKVQFLTLSWNGKDKLEKLYPTVKNSMKGMEWSWLIKDNGSKDGSVEAIKNWEDSHIQLMECEHNKHSYSQGMNILFKEASLSEDDIVITLNNDVIINDESSIKNMVSLLNSDKEIGLVGAKLNYTDTDKLQHAGVLFSRHNGLPFHYRAKMVEEGRDRANRYYPCVTGAVSAMKAGVFANCHSNKSEMKGFNEDYVFGFEDIDMSLRALHNLKLKNVYCGKTNIFHEESASLKKNPVHHMFFQKNCRTFMDCWRKNIDVSLIDKYENPDYALYRA